ncbi:hypothetical protein TNCV_1213611 [Trichonephila clavipes]|nr:hypothetical protein TNCV_1213611 [Trichonephila clavipes]
MSINRYTNSKLADIHFFYDLANGNERVAVRFVLLYILHCDLTVFVSLYLVRVTFPPMFSYVVMAPQDVLYLLSKFVHGIRGHPV